jgi:hypothetical protein
VESRGEALLISRGGRRDAETIGQRQVQVYLGPDNATLGSKCLPWTRAVFGELLNDRLGLGRTSSASRMIPGDVPGCRGISARMEVRFSRRGPAYIINVWLFGCSDVRMFGCSTCVDKLQLIGKFGG